MRSLAKHFLPIALAALFPLPMAAQKGGRHGGGIRPSSPPSGTIIYSNPRSTEGAFDVYPITEPDIEKKLSTTGQPACFQFPMAPVASSTVSASRMTVPAEAKKEFGKACVAVRKKKLKDAQRHLQRAIDAYSKFADAWVLLGQTEEDQGNLQAAEQSCEQARAVDAGYLPGYLCLADIAARQGKWQPVADLTGQVIAMHPVKAPGAFFYNLLGHYYLKQWDPAEKSALAALKDGSKEEGRQVRWLLAKVYEIKGDRTSEAEQLREYIKLYPDDRDTPIARQVLRQIEAKGYASQKPDKQ
ncbi:MAG: tetratricopeptide repeat protein [Actinomycetota bacterium]